MRRAFLIPAFLGVAAMAPLHGHHGWAGFDRSTEITLKGIVVGFHYVNPHSVVEFEVKDAKGHVDEWQGEMNSPNRLAPFGWKASTLQEGDSIQVTGHPAKNGSRAVWVSRIVPANGMELKMGTYD